MTDLIVTKWQGLVPYIEAWDAMKAWTGLRTPDTVDELWLMQHPAVYTQGLAGSAEHVLNPKNIPVVQTDRGGQITYHGPGQLMLYSLFDINRLGLSTRDYVRCLEQVVIDLLSDYRITAQARVEAPGVYVGEKKICSIGLRVTKGCSYHGCAVNISGDLEPFNGINPCGFNSLEMTCIEDYVPVTLDEVAQKVCQYFFIRFGFSKPDVHNEQRWESYEH